MYNIKEILSYEHLQKIINPDKGVQRLFTQLCERSFLNLRDWLQQHREVLISEDKTRYCKRIISGAISTPEEKGNFIEFINNFPIYENNEELVDLKQDESFIGIARSVRKAFFKHLPVKEEERNPTSLESFKGHFSMGVSSSIREMSEEARNSGFRRHFTGHTPPKQTTFAQRALQEKGRQENINITNTSSFVSRATPKTTIRSRSNSIDSGVSADLDSDAEEKVSSNNTQER
jgi:hypothetical protein